MLESVIVCDGERVMTAHRVRADYEALDQIAERFDGQSENTYRVLAQLHRDLDVLLNGDWVGGGALGFHREMISEVLPSVKRLAEALRQAAQATREMSRVMQQAEEACAALFRVERVGGAVWGAGDEGPRGSAGSGPHPSPPPWLWSLMPHAPFLAWLLTQGSGEGAAAGAPRPDRAAAVIEQTPAPGAASREAIEFIARFEGIRLELYDDPSGNCTIGAGHLVHLGVCDGGVLERGFAGGITVEQAYGLLAEDVAGAERAVDALVTAALSQHQYDALVSFVFNVGRGNFERSDLLSRLNAGDYEAVPDKLNRWVYGSDRSILPGLQTRRRQEGELFSDGIYGGGP